MPENNNLKSNNQMDSINSGNNPQNNTNKYINAQQNNNQTAPYKAGTNNEVNQNPDAESNEANKAAIRAAGAVAGKVGGGYGKAIEAGVKIADATGLTDVAAEKMTKINKLGMGKHLQGALNKAHQSGATEAIEKTANSMSTPGAEGAKSGLNPGNATTKSSGLDSLSNNAGGSSNSSGSGDIMGDLAKSYFQKHKLMIIASCSGIAFFVLILFVILGGGAEAANESNGYYDAACNFNDTYVTVTNCEEEPEVIASVNIKDYVLGSTYAYTEGSNYSDDAIKAAMIVIKTNALSYGNYNSGSKQIDLESCSSHNKYCDINNGCDLEPASDEYKEKLESLYEEISTYLYVSKSYNSAITNLSSANALEFNNNILDEFESLSENNDYISILDSYYEDSSNSDEVVVNNNVLFIGDSRTHGMVLAGALNDSNSVYATGKGYEWFVGNQTASNGTNAPNGGIKAANDKIDDTNSYNIVIWLGVNDLGNVNAYFNKYKELATNEWSRHTIYVVSVGPVDDDKSEYAKNSSINNFNNTIRNLINNSGLSNLKFIDLNLDITSLNSSDGLHYSSEGSKKIYNIISNSVGFNISGELSLYNMSSYCTYYNLTENDAYWWPIGSDEPTNGNIYGGDPTAKTVTSKYGWRYLQHRGNDWHEGIDIGGNYTDVIIAIKEGIVRDTSNTCPSTGSEKTYCGEISGWGNYVIIEHYDGMISYYLHLSKDSIVVREGEIVKQGQKIALMGSSGNSTGPHLHFGMKLENSYVNPLDYISVDNPRPISNYADVNIKVVGDTGNYSDSAKNKSVVCNSLLASGFSRNATIGIMVNMQVESNHKYNPQVVEIGSGYTYETIYSAPASEAAGFGIIQWSFGRRINLINYAKENNWDAASLLAQLNFLYHEISTKKSYDITEKYITGNYNANDIAIAFCKNFERPGGSVKDLNTYDDCFERSENWLTKITNYVNNGCRE